MSKASKVGMVRLGMVGALLLAAPSAWAQGGVQAPPAQPGSPTGPAAQPAQGPTLVISSDGSVQGEVAATPEQDRPQTLTLPPKEAGAKPKPLIWAGTVFFADQSINSEAVGVGKDYQSRNPSFQLWMSFRPRISLINGDRDKLTFTGRIDGTKEFTNSDSTTQYRELELGDTWLDLRYARVLVRRNGWGTTLSLGPRVLLPTSKVSQNNGLYASVGAGAGILQTFPLNRGSEWFASGRVLGSATYTHAFTEATTPTLQDPRVAAANSTVSATNPNASVVTNQSAGNFLANHQVLSVIDTGVQITPKLGLTVDTIFIQRWSYRPTNSCFVTQDSPECKPVQSSSLNANPQNYRLSIYFLASVDYQLTDELNLSFNYYNFANTIGASGQRQNMFYAPEGARFSLTATLGLDALYERFVGVDAGPGKGAQGSRVARGNAGNAVMSF